jgi:hypothetical protein
MIVSDGGGMTLDGYIFRRAAVASSIIISSVSRSVWVAASPAINATVNPG